MSRVYISFLLTLDRRRKLNQRSDDIMLKLCQSFFCPFHPNFNAYYGSSRSTWALPLAGFLKLISTRIFKTLGELSIAAAGDWDNFLTVVEIPEFNSFNNHAGIFYFFYKTYWIIKKFILRYKRLERTFISSIKWTDQIFQLKTGENLRK